MHHNARPLLIRLLSHCQRAYIITWEYEVTPDSALLLNHIMWPRFCTDVRRPWHCNYGLRLAERKAQNNHMTRNQPYPPVGSTVFELLRPSPSCVSPATSSKRSNVYPRDHCSDKEDEPETNIHMCWPQKEAGRLLVQSGTALQMLSSVWRKRGCRQEEKSTHKVLTCTSHWWGQWQIEILHLTVCYVYVSSIPLFYGNTPLLTMQHSSSKRLVLESMKTYIENPYIENLHRITTQAPRSSSYHSIHSSTTVQHLSRASFFKRGIKSNISLMHAMDQ